MSRTRKTLAVIAVIALPIGLWFGVVEFRKATADYRGEARQIEAVEANERFRMQAYDHFFDLCASVQTHEARITNLVDELDGASEGRAEQLRSAITASKNQRADLINTYNADAAKDWTSGQFLASNLPFRLDIAHEETSCAA